MVMPTTTSDHEAGDSFISDDEEELCPLCVEEMDLSDKNFFPCPCGYQVCQFCYNNIRQNPQLNGKCPACRRPYNDENVEYRTVTAEEWKQDHMRQTRKEKERKQREREKKESENSSKKHHLSGMRVIQKNLVYVIGLNPNIPTDELHNTLRGDQFFGQYGKIQKIVINRRTNAHGNPGIGVYVTFAKKEDAARCIAAVDGSLNDNKYLRAAYGTTKYCSSYLRGQPCPNPNCMFLHEPGEEADSYTRQDLSTIQHAARQGIKPQNKSGSAKSAAGSANNSTATPTNTAPATSDDIHDNNNDSSENSISSSGGASALPATASWAAHNRSASPPVNQTKLATAASKLVPEPEPPTPEKAIKLINRNLETLSKSSFTYAFSSAWLTEEDLADPAKLPSFFTYSKEDAAPESSGESNINNLLTLLTSQNCGLGSNNNTSLLTLPQDNTQEDQQQQKFPELQPQNSGTPVQQQTQPQTNASSANTAAKAGTLPPGLFSGHHQSQPSNPDRQVLLAQLMNGGKDNLFQQDQNDNNDDDNVQKDKNDMKKEETNPFPEELFAEYSEELLLSAADKDEVNELDKKENTSAKSPESEQIPGPSLLYPMPYGFGIPPIPPSFLPPAEFNSPMPPAPPPGLSGGIVPPPYPMHVGKAPPPPYPDYSSQITPTIPPPRNSNNNDSEPPTEDEQKLLSLIKGPVGEQSTETENSATVMGTPPPSDISRDLNESPLSNRQKSASTDYSSPRQAQPRLNSKASVDNSLGEVVSKKEGGDNATTSKKLSRRQQKKLEQAQLRQASESARQDSTPVVRGAAKNHHEQEGLIHQTARVENASFTTKNDDSVEEKEVTDDVKEQEKEKKKEVEEEKGRKRKEGDEEKEIKKKKAADEEKAKKRKAAEEERERKQKAADEEKERKKRIAEEDQERKRKALEEKKKRVLDEEKEKMISTLEEEKEREIRVVKEEKERKKRLLEKERKKMIAHEEGRNKSAIEEVGKEGKGKAAEEEKEKKTRAAEEEIEKKRKAVENGKDKNRKEEEERKQKTAGDQEMERKVEENRIFDERKSSVIKDKGGVKITNIPSKNEADEVAKEILGTLTISREGDNFSGHASVSKRKEYAKFIKDVVLQDHSFNDLYEGEVDTYNSESEGDSAPQTPGNERSDISEVMGRLDKEYGIESSLYKAPIFSHTGSDSDKYGSAKDGEFPTTDSLYWVRLPPEEEEGKRRETREFTGTSKEIDEAMENGIYLDDAEELLREAQAVSQEMESIMKESNKRLLTYGRLFRWWSSST